MGFAAFAALGINTAPAAAQACPDPAPLIGDAAGAMAHVRYLADDALEGRGTASRGERCAAAYIAGVFESMGLEPAGDDGSWTQSFQVRSGSELAAVGALTVSGLGNLGTGSGTAPWRPYGFSGSDRVVAPLVYGGAGVAPAGAEGDALPEATGKIMVIEAATDQVPAGSVYADPHFRATVAQGRGAAGLVILLGPGQALPELATEDKPFVRIPVAAVGGLQAEALRARARAGAWATLEVNVRPRMAEALNVVALLPGSDPALRDQVVVVGAHYDHLGYGGAGSFTPEVREIHNGADDNASGTAALLLIADELARGSAPRRPVLFIAFSGEERGLLGSAHFVAHPTVEMGRAAGMINLDMVGRLREDRLTVFGVATAPEWEGILTRGNRAQARPFQLSLMPDGYGPSDHSSFYGAGIPVLHFFTNTHSEYHRPVDDWETLNGQGIDRIAALVADVTAQVAGAEGTAMASLTLVEQAPPQPAQGGGRGYGPYFGSIPDMGSQEYGVRLSGVRSGSPADRAGLQGGDVIVSFGGREVGDLYAYTYALRDMAPGDRVEVGVLRDGQRMTFLAVLGERR